MFDGIEIPESVSEDEMPDTCFAIEYEKYCRVTLQAGAEPKSLAWYGRYQRGVVLPAQKFSTFWKRRHPCFLQDGPDGWEVMYQRVTDLLRKRIE